YFKANWLEDFPKEATEPAAFTLADGKTVQVPMLQNQATYGYATVDGHQIIELPYVGGQVAMLVVLPAEGKFEALESSLSLAKYDEFVGALSRKFGTLKLPRFTFDSSFTLSQPLKKLGMKLPFSPDADFSGIDGTQDLFI